MNFITTVLSEQTIFLGAETTVLNCDVAERYAFALLYLLFLLAVLSGIIPGTVEDIRGEVLVLAPIEPRAGRTTELVTAVTVIVRRIRIRRLAQPVGRHGLQPPLVVLLLPVVPGRRRALRQVLVLRLHVFVRWLPRGWCGEVA